MKKFIIIVSTLVALYIFGDYAYYHLGWYIDMDPGKPVTTFVKTEGTEFRILKDGQWEDFEIKGVNIGSGEPGQWSTDFDIDEESYYRWFGYIQEMGANTIRVYTIQADEFYNAFYAYNQGRDEPLYLIHGVWVNDYVQNSHMDAYDERFFDIAEYFPKEYFGVPLSISAREMIAQNMSLVNSKGRPLKWPSIAAALQRCGNQIKETRIKNQRFHTVYPGSLSA